MSEQPAGPVLDALGVALDIEDNQQITEVVVLAKCVDFETNEVGLVLAASVGLDWIAQRGLVSAAQQVLNEVPTDG